MGKILLTGGSGFIATNFLQYLSQFPAEEVVMFDRKYGQDLRDRETVRKAILGKGYSDVFHLGALTNIDASIKEPAPFMESNVTGTFNVLEAVREENARRDSSGEERMRVVYVSTSEVYGTSQCEPEPMDEKHLLCPHSPYAAAKTAADRLCYAYWQTYGLPVKIVRPFNQYGPYQDEGKLIPKLVRCALEGMPFPVYAEGEARRDWVYVYDTCEALWMARGLPDGTAVNIATGRNYTVVEVCEMVRRLMKARASKVVHVDHVDDRWGHVKCLRGNPSLAKELMGWTPKTSLEDGLRLTISWYLAQWDCQHGTAYAQPPEPVEHTGPADAGERPLSSLPRREQARVAAR